MVQIPRFSQLLLNEGDPPFSAWGVYGKDDELGTINRLTKDVVLAAARSEIQTGERFSLNLPLDALGKDTMVGRQSFELKQWQKAPRIVNDDIWTFNSQDSTQWDGLRHFAYQKEAKFYNGVTLDDMYNEDKTKKSNINGVEKWEEKGIVGRGVLLDYDRWRRKQGLSFSRLPTGESVTKIPIEHLKAVAADQGTEIKFGDILFLRSGFTAAFEEASPSERQTVSEQLRGSGVEQSEEALERLWENFSAVAYDHVAYELWPSAKPWFMHEILLSGCGMPIGELFDLEKVAKHCQEVNRWSFFLASEICHVPGAVASPPNALAIF